MNKNSSAEKNKKPSAFSTLKSVAYIMKLMYSISPGLVVGSIAIKIFSMLPNKLVSVIGIKYIIDEVQSGGSTAKIFTAVAVIAVLLIAASCVEALFFQLYEQKESESLYAGIYSRLYEAAARVDMQSLDNPKFYSDFMLALETSSTNLQNILVLVRNYAASLVSLIAISSVVISIDPVCLIIVLVFVLAFIPVSRKIGVLQMERRKAVTEAHRKSDYFARLFYLPEYAGEIRMNGLAPLLLKRFSQSADEIKDIQKRHVLPIDTLYFVQGTSVEVIGFMLVLTLYIGYRAIVSKTLTAGDFTATFNGAVQIGSLISFLTISAARTLTEQGRMIEKYREFLDFKPSLKEGSHTAQRSKPEKIEIKNVSFSYGGSRKESVKNVSLTINPGEKIALVGYNGAGKTTLTNLILRLYDVSDGEILIGERNIKDETTASHRDRFAAVFQDFKIFGATVGENVALSPVFDEDRVWAALKAADFDKNLPDGLNSVLLREFDENGVMLSGGEQQKIAVARAFYKRCPYIILDEPSANLDPISEYELNRSVANYARDKTVIFISHRLSTTRSADKIYMMENGEIIESGSHEELMALNGRYAYMFNLQAEKYRQSV